jgi:hypothetical protein
MTKVSDEMLMALADGELDPETAATVQRSVETDPALQRRLAEFRRSRRIAKQAVSGVLDEAGPTRLVAAVGSGGRSRPLRPALLPVGAALAASVAGFVVAWAIFQRPAMPPLLPTEEIARLMEATPSSDETVPLAGNAGSVKITASYPVPDGTCRSFAARTAGGEGEPSAWQGVACRHDGSWTVDLMVADRIADDGGGFQPASDQATQSIDAFLDAAGAGERLDAAAEDALRAGGWQSGAQQR